MKRINAENTVVTLLFIALLCYPLFSSAYKVLNMSYFLAMLFLPLSLALIWGFTGIFSFGQTAFFGFAGYAYAMFSLNFNLPSLNILFILLALLTAGVIAWILGWFMFYGGVNDVFVGLVTLCVTLVLSTFMAQTAGSQWKIGSVPLGGDNGINNIPPVSLGYGDFIIIFKGLSLYYFILILLIVVYLSMRWLLISKLGYSMLAIRENRERSNLSGFNIPFLQTLTFALGGMLAGLSGVLYAAWGGFMAPSSMNIAAAALPVVLVAAAGRKNLTAVMIFTLFYYFFSQYLSVSGSEYALIILGLILVLVILLVPQGIVLGIFNVLDYFILEKIGNRGKEEQYQNGKSKDQEHKSTGQNDGKDIGTKTYF